jgi:hypothetical protein
MSDYPEHDKLHQVADKSQAIGQFLDVFLGEKGLVLAEYNGDDERPRLYPATVRIDLLLAEFFDIDLKKIENEKRAMLETMRSQQ